MGLFDFVKSAGAAIFDKDDQPETPVASGPSPEEVQKLKDRRRAANLVRVIEGLGFEVENMTIKIQGDVATIGGSVNSQADREKVILAVGNTAGVAQVDDRLEVEADEPEATMYTVQSGDSLSRIAKRHYGDAMKYPMIFEANKPMLSDPDKIYPEQVLRLPPLEN